MRICGGILKFFNRMGPYFDFRFIMFLMESPLSTHFKAFTEFRSFFNWTMTYRRDSDIVASYGRIQPIVPGFQIASVPKPFIPHQ